MESESNDVENKLHGIINKINCYDLTDNNSDEIWFTCSCCKKKVNFDCYRYKCLYCDDYDLCSKCFERRQTNKKHVNGHPLVRFSEKNQWFGRHYDSLETLTLDKLAKDFQHETHQDITCSVCTNPILGLRFKCETCSDGYEMCLTCFKKSRKLTGQSHTADHTIVVMGNTILNNIDLEQLVSTWSDEDKLGQGAFGQVFKATLKDTNQKVACKIIHYNGSKEESERLFLSFKRELKAYKEIKGENVLKLIGYSTKIISSNIVDLYLLTEFMEKGNLTKLLETERDMSYRRRLDIAVDIASGMSRIHDLGFIHRDIRPDNILISANNVAKIGDMGIAKFIDESKGQQTVFGHVKYMPSEIIGGNYTKKLDVFTFGLTMLELFGYSFSREYDRYGINLVVINDPLRVFGRLFELCLSSSPDQRPEARVIEEYLTKFKRFMIDLIRLYPSYISLNTEAKNKLFELVFESVHKENFDNNLNPKYKPSTNKFFGFCTCCTIC